MIGVRQLPVTTVKAVDAPPATAECHFARISKFTAGPVVVLAKPAGTYFETVTFDTVGPVSPYAEPIPVSGGYSGVRLTRAGIWEANWWVGADWYTSVGSATIPTSPDNFLLTRSRLISSSPVGGFEPIAITPPVKNGENPGFFPGDPPFLRYEIQGPTMQGRDVVVVFGDSVDVGLEVQVKLQEETTTDYNVQFTAQVELTWVGPTNEPG